MEAIPRDERGNPLTLEGVIKSMMLKGPDMMPHRDHALNLLYCTLGTGIDWTTDGRLGDRLPNNYINMPPDAGGQGCWSRDFGLDDSLKRIFKGKPKLLKEFETGMRRDRDKEFIAIFETIDNIDKRCKTYSKKRTSWYPISWYHCHLCVPADAQEDFRAGAIETINLILKTKAPPNTKNAIRLKDSQKVAKEMLAALTKVGKGKKKKGKK